ncbi:prostaglandin E synthase 2 [Rhipicephalus sanguineus]|uniref:prostaglandin E synthase 2 n=1 Tax=Rhipicephalus sanguineus TaxID=34632 RepID=UPI00189554C9|nr:prostaglandin E synthase 2 [Rhipicephalus sanguineus]
MAALSAQFARCASLAKCLLPPTTYSNIHAAKLSSFAHAGPKWKYGKLRFLAVAGIACGAVGHAYMRSVEPRKDPIGDMLSPLNIKNISNPGTKISRVVNGPTEKTGLKITMYQYQTCPFCCKVRAFLDFYGIPYNVIEVDPVLRQQLKFSDYKKVPILLVEEAGNCWQINDSTVIISMLQSYLRDVKSGFRKYLCLYDPVKVQDASGKESLEVFNKYFLMMDNGPAEGKAFNDIKEEVTWRMWADDVLVHVLSPNVYRTWPEALQAFNYFSKVGEWEKNFPTWERLLVVYVGATAMYFVAKRLKKRHNLKDDVRESFRDACREWTKAVGTEQKFHGGNLPNLADLAVYGVLSSVEGCTAFEDMLADTKIGPWYYRMKEATSSHAGTRALSTTMR